MTADPPNTPHTAAPTRLGRSLGAFWQLDPAERDQLFDVVIVGSGYAGAVAAHELCGRCDGDRPLKVALLERGREYLPGEFPAQFDELPAHLRFTQQAEGRVHGNFEGLFDLRLGNDVAALVANGLGGGSLINAGVMLAPDPTDPGLSCHKQLAELVRALHNERHFDQARALLNASADHTIVRHPKVSAAEPLHKAEALKKLGGAATRAVPITVALGEEVNTANVTLPSCTLCGDCLTGCNVGAKNSHDANLLEGAVRRGLEVITAATVLSLRRGTDLAQHESDNHDCEHRDSHWVLRVVHTDTQRQLREPTNLKVFARHVVLAAGTLGTTEILLRSRSDKLAFSPQLGRGFSCNGDNLAAVHGTPKDADGAADANVPVDQRRVGPTITHSFSRHRIGDCGPTSYEVQEFAVPGALSMLYDEVVTTTSALHRLAEGDESEHGSEPPDGPDPLAVSRAAMRKTLLVGVIGHDDAKGVLSLARPVRPRDRPAQQGGLRIDWPEARRAKALRCPMKTLRELTEALAPGAQLLPNPAWQLLPKSLADLVSQPYGPVLTVHPLGGCAVGQSVQDGVVDECGRVLNAAADDAHVCPKEKQRGAWEGTLLVLDGAALGGSLGVNPALTITAFALRGIKRFIACRGYRPGDALPPELRARRRLDDPMSPQPGLPPPPHPPRPTRIEVIERLSGPATLTDGSRVVVELSVAYRRLGVRELLTQMQRSLPVQETSRDSRVRVFDADEWLKRALAGANDDERAPFALAVASLAGQLDLLHRESTTACQRRRRSAWAWLLNRGLRDTVDWVRERWSTPTAANRPSPGFDDRFASLLKLASRAGEVRRFDYRLSLGKVLELSDRAPQALRRSFVGGQPVSGAKRLTYARRANPWRQLTELTLLEFPGLEKASAPVLTLDARFLANKGLPLLRIVEQENHARALVDLLSLAMYFVRLMISVHLWTFRKPDAPDLLREPVRLPGPVRGLPSPEVTELVVDRMPDTALPVSIRLTRYTPSKQAESKPRPLVLIHGYSVSGNTFTHPSLVPSAVEFFAAEQGRDVWVVDLRTSTALPGSKQPWSMEQVALIDIPAALLHIHHATGQRLDVLAHCIGCVMLSMAILTRASEVRSGSIELGTESWLTSEQLGTLHAFNERHGDRKLHPVIERIVLSQKGPLLRYTDGNIFRAYVMQTLRRWLMSDDYSFRPPASPAVADELLDRLLASLPYPDREFDVENPLWPCAKTPWITTRHRMDALYGRDFEAANLRPETLKAIDDLFGPIHLDTVSQTIHFARFSAVTNQRGRGEFVTRARLRARWGGIATLAIHGRQNGLVDLHTQRLLQAAFQDADVPFAGDTFDDIGVLGHQDSMIGVHAKQVFARIAKFLDDIPPATHASAGGSLIDVPWVGPRMDFDEADGKLYLACRARPDQGPARLVLIPATRFATGFQIDQDPATVVIGEPVHPSNWLRLAVPLGSPPKAAGWLALLLYDIADTTAQPGRSSSDPSWPPPPKAVAPSTRPAEPSALPVISAMRPIEAVPSPIASLPALPPVSWLHTREPLLGHLGRTGASTGDEVKRVAIELAGRKGRDELELAYVSHQALVSADALHRANQPQGLKLAFASCQYPAGLFDGVVAGGSLRHMAKWQGEAQSRFQVALFVGDQIYADATAGIADPMRSDERYAQPAERALRAPPMRELLRQVPAYMLLDDHEIDDNWEPVTRKVAFLRPREAKVLEDQRRQGIAAWHHVQQMHKAQLPKAPRSLDYETRLAGIPFRFVDTRSGRRARNASQTGSIISWQAMDGLLRWLGEHKAATKFVITPSLLLPRRRSTRDDMAKGAAPRTALGSDAWDGYPTSLSRVLEAIVEHDIRHTVFLSGDEHHSLWATIDLHRADGRKARITSIHSSALYAPFPFANGRPAELAAQPANPGHGYDHFDIGPLTVAVTTHFADPGDGYATIDIDPRCHAVELRFLKARLGTSTPAVRIEL